MRTPEKSLKNLQINFKKIKMLVLAVISVALESTGNAQVNCVAWNDFGASPDCEIWSNGARCTVRSQRGCDSWTTGTMCSLWGYRDASYVCEQFSNGVICNLWQKQGLSTACAEWSNGSRCTSWRNRRGGSVCESWTGGGFF